MRKEFDFTIGADPEFNIVANNKKISAIQTFQKVFPKNELLQMGYKCGNFGEIGWDGSDGTAELRPKPAKTADELVGNIEKILQKTYEKIPLFEMLTLSYYSSVGGHLHFSIPDRISKNGIRVINRKMAAFYIPILVGDNKVNIKLRDKCGYGRITDYRVETRQDINVYEFRAPSAEWLTSKKIALSTIAYLATVYNEIINHPRKISKYSDLIFKSDLQAKAIQDLAISDYLSVTKNIIKNIQKNIKTFEFYPEYKEEIDFILNPKEVLKEKQRHEFNIVNGWGFHKNVRMQKKSVLSQKATKKRLKEKNIDDVNLISGVYFNPDINVEFFRQILGERMYAYSWKLKNEYFLFGLKDGIKDYMVFNTNGDIYSGIKNIQTEEDLSETKNLFQKIIQKYKEATRERTSTSTQLAKIINGQTKEKNNIMIGIPYQQRISHKTNEFLSIIYDMEKKMPKAINLSAINPKALAVVGSGPIATAYKKTTETPIFYEREGSRSQTMINNAIKEILNESIQENIDELSQEIQQDEIQYISLRTNDVVQSSVRRILTNFSVESEVDIAATETLSQASIYALMEGIQIDTGNSLNTVAEWLDAWKTEQRANIMRDPNFYRDPRHEEIIDDEEMDEETYED